MSVFYASVFQRVGRAPKMGHRFILMGLCKII